MPDIIIFRSFRGAVAGSGGGGRMIAVAAAIRASDSFYKHFNLNAYSLAIAAHLSFGFLGVYFEDLLTLLGVKATNCLSQVN